jgi:hypothetical protein
MPLKFWDEAFVAATYLINRTPAKLLNFSTPYEHLLKEKPDYSMLRVFGCACWPNLRPYNARKLEFRSKRCAFIGYSNMHKGFKCLDISTGRVYISRDVVFDETMVPFSELHANAGARLQAEVHVLPDNLLNPSFSFSRGQTLHRTSMANSSDDVHILSNENATENSTPQGVSPGYSMQGELSMPIETDTTSGSAPGTEPPTSPSGVLDEFALSTQQPTMCASHVRAPGDSTPPAQGGQAGSGAPAARSAAGANGIFNYLPTLRVTLLELPFLHLLLHNRHRVSEKLTFLPLCPTWRHTSALQRVSDVANKWEKSVLPLPLSTKPAPGLYAPRHLSSPSYPLLPLISGWVSTAAHPSAGGIPLSAAGPSSSQLDGLKV